MISGSLGQFRVGANTRLSPSTPFSIIITINSLHLDLKLQLTLDLFCSIRLISHKFKHFTNTGFLLMRAPLKSSRTQTILNMLGEQGNVSIRSLSAKLNVSEMTLRRDLSELESRGLARRVHGGGVLASDRDPGYWLRYKQFQKEKRMIGKATASLIQADQTIYLDTGTTAIEVARALVRRSLEENLRVRVVTHAINVGAELAGNPKISLHQIGGEIFPDTLGATGRDTVQNTSIFEGYR